jgi:hypothetical protein
MPKGTISYASLVATALTLSTLASNSASAKIYVFDKGRTEIRFTFRMGPAKQQGRFSRVHGSQSEDVRSRRGNLGPCFRVVERSSLQIVKVLPLKGKYANQRRVDPRDRGSEQGAGRGWSSVGFGSERG